MAIAADGAQASLYELQGREVVALGKLSPSAARVRHGGRGLSRGSQQRISEFTAIRAVSKTLQALLQDHITNSPDPQLRNVPIDLSSPREMRDTAAPNTGPNGISLWLYRVARNADVLNGPPVPRDGELPRPLLPVDLFYLVAPITRVPDDGQALLGRVLQVFSDHRPAWHGAEERPRGRGDRTAPNPRDAVA